MRRFISFVSVAGLVVLISANALAFDARVTQESLTAKAVALVPNAPNFDASRAALYLQDPVWRTWNLAHGGNWTAQFDTLTGHPRRAYGGAIPFTNNVADLESVTRAFIAANPSVLGVSNASLRYVPEAATAVKSGRVRYAAFDYVVNGVSVESARLIFAVNNGNMIYWSSTNIASVPTATTPTISPTQALSNVLAHAGISQAQITLVNEPALTLLPRSGAAGALLSYQLAYKTSFRVAGSLGTWSALVDALTGTIIAFGDTNDYASPGSCGTRTTAAGRVIGGIRPAQATDAEVVRSFPFVAVEHAERSLTTSGNGVFTFSGGAATTGLDGTFFDTLCVDCVKSQSDPQSGFQPFASAEDGRVDLGTGGFDVVQGAGLPTTAYGNGVSTPADRTAFFHTNVARGIALKWMNLSWLQSKVAVRVNINDVCNAFWDGSALNFFKSGELLSGTTLLKCRNTGEIRDVMQHEWGHGLDGNDGEQPGYAAGLGDFATGEAVADHIAIFVDHDSCIGQSFFNRSSGPFVTDPDSMTISTCDGVRNVDELRNSRGTLTVSNVAQKCPAPSTGNPLYFGPLLREGHCEGEIWGQTTWHLANDLISGRKYGTVTLDANKQFVTYAGDALPPSSDGSPNPAFDKDAAWTIVEHLYFDSRPLVAAHAPSRYQAMGGSAYDGFMVADDEGDGLANGTPHAAYINDAFVHHGLEEWGPPGIMPSGVDAKNCTAPATPNVTLAQSIDSASGTPAVTISWGAVSGAASYSVLRNERRNDVFLEVGRVSGATTFTDIGVDNGVSYNYRVQANGNTGCFAVSANGVKTIAVGQPDAQPSNYTIVEFPGGNSDGALDAGETASLYVWLANPGAVSLTGVTATITSLTPGVTVYSGAVSYPNIGPGDEAAAVDAFTISARADGALCGKTVTLLITVTSAQGCFSVPMLVPIGVNGGACYVYGSAHPRAKSVTITSDTADNTCGDGDLTPDPGETVQITVQVENIGSTYSNGTAVKLVSNKPYITIPNDTSVLGTIAPFAGETMTATFNARVSRLNVPFADLATFTAIVSASNLTAPTTTQLNTIVNRDLVTQTKSYAFESSDEGWTSSNPTTGWKRTTAPNTGDLTTLWHSQYATSECDYLVSPNLELTASSAISFDLAYASENSDDAYDGMDVQVSLDGGRTWSSIEPTQGYSAISAGSSCVPKGHGFFSGVSPLMARYDANLGAWAGRTAQVRFRFASDTLVDANPAGAWIDNVTTSNVVVSVPDTPCP